MLEEAEEYRGEVEAKSHTSCLRPYTKRESCLEEEDSDDERLLEILE